MMNTPFCDPRSRPVSMERHQYLIDTPITPVPPGKVILGDPQLVNTFVRTAAHAKILFYVAACAEAVFRTPFSSCLSEEGPQDATVRFLVEVFFPHLHQIVDAIPLEESRRFGNPAKRVFHDELEKSLPDMMARLAKTFDPHPLTVEVQAELAAYLRDAFGDATRLDYGSGHELHFFIFVCICLEIGGDTGALTDLSFRDIQPHMNNVSLSPHPLNGEAATTTTAGSSGSGSGAASRQQASKEDLIRRRKEFVACVFREYLRFARRLQTHYTLEPAGSHGSWGLDDFHHLPYVFGAAQLVLYDPSSEEEEQENQQQRRHPSLQRGSDGCRRGSDTAAGASVSASVPSLLHACPAESFLPSDVCYPDKVKAYADDFFYPNMILWINTHKRGPFFEHSNMLYNISSVPTWRKTYQGMMKMYAAEALGKFNVIQHFLFGSHYPWQTKTLEEVAEEHTVPPLLDQ